MFLLPILVQQLAPEGDFFAVSIAAGSDLNGDRVPDLVIGDTTNSLSARVWIVSGRDGSLLATHDSGPASCVFVDFLGDIDRDGRSEVGIATQRYPTGGGLEILSGGDSLTLRSVSVEDLGLQRIEGMCAAGSVDADGGPDLLVTGFASLAGKTYLAGMSLVLSGSTAESIWRLADDRVYERAGHSYAWMAIAGVGDLDADDRDDFAVADFDHDPLMSVGTEKGGRVLVYSGRTGLPLFKLAAPQPERSFGRSLDGGADFDGDLCPDILVGSPDPWGTSGTSGRLRVYSGRDGSLLHELDRTAFLRKPRRYGEWFGVGSRFVGDIDGDHRPDLLVGIPNSEEFGGGTYLCSGRTGTVSFAIEDCSDPGETGWPRALSAVMRISARAGDVDQDGLEDFAIACHSLDGFQFGVVRVFSGTGKCLLRIDRASLLAAKPAVPSVR